MAIQTLNITKSGSGRGTVTSDVGGPPIDCGDTCTTIETAGEVVTLTATPTRGSRFIRWTGDIPTSTNRVVSYTQTLNPTNINAEFRSIKNKNSGAPVVALNIIYIELSKFENSVPEILPYNGTNYVFDSVGQFINDQWTPVTSTERSVIGLGHVYRTNPDAPTLVKFTVVKKGSQMVEPPIANIGGGNRVSGGGAGKGGAL